MKIRYALLPAVAMLAAACTTRPIQPRLGSIDLDTLIGTRDAGCNITYRFATIANAQDSPALTTIEESALCSFFELEAFTGTPRQAMNEAIGQITQELLPAVGENSPAWGSYEISVESEASVVDTLLCYAITRSSFTGGAHGSYTTEYHTYSLDGGYELCLADLFQEAQLARMDELVRHNLYAAYNAQTKEEMAAQGFFPEYFSLTENFRISPEGITFLYNPYDIGCYALGPVEVGVSSEELHAL